MTIITFTRGLWAFGFGTHDGAFELYIWKLIIRFQKDRSKAQ